MVSGMLTAIRDFVQDSFKVAEDEGLQTLKVGELTVWIEQGPHALLAVVVRGTAPPALRATLQQALESVHAQYSDLLESFDGDTARFEGARPLLEACLQQQFRGRKRRRDLHRRLRCSPRSCARARRVAVLRGPRARPMECLRRQPPHRAGHRRRVDRRERREVHGQRAARSAGTRSRPCCCRRTSSDAGAVDGRWELYQALHPALVLARARQLLAPPGGVTLELQEGVSAGGRRRTGRVDRDGVRVAR